MTRYGMVVDLKGCFGCQACAAACKIANNLPIGMAYNVVYTKTDDDPENPGTAVIKGAAVNDTPYGEYPDLKLGWMPKGCQHCDNASCVEVCPTGATYQREDGIVNVDTEQCIGCQSCIEACPYDVRTYIESEPSYYIDFAVGELDAPAHAVNTVEKCTFCANLIDRGETPACMELCPGRCRFWGDLDDPESDASRALEGREYYRLNEAAGTEPKVYYLK
ncbi:4Fe-4S dicluster domain-containing protein [Adlercreutzia sp. R7]|uniref:4Fe-4S dicluster domain-containing protein n=1 Tax=Adlercreutzia wanghongyangiae TaxID=3111451 RepID=A0ABU6IGF5_9ACTN|nr:4Fe-4S dicluster domain-containing protein [Adlercreutzia sp. R7]